MSDNQSSYKDLIKKFRRQCKQWNERGIDAVFNKDLVDADIGKVKYIVVADNPGDNEKIESRYLCESDEGNRSGRIARQIFSMIFKNQPYLVLNKTPIHTPKTNDLKRVSKEVLKETMEYMAVLIHDLNGLNRNVQVYIFGLGNSFDAKKQRLRRGGVGKYFFWKIKELYADDDLKEPIIAKHFSRYSLFRDFPIGDKKMKFRDLCEENAEDFLNAMNKLPYKDWMMNT